jgi:tetratricopeptide (TPR) repeat protein
MAREVDDPALLGYALDATHMAIWGPDNTHERLAITGEMLQVGEATGDLERLFQAHTYRMWSLLELGEPNAVAAELEVMTRLAGQLRQPAQTWMAAVARTVCALLQGQFEHAEEMIEDAFDVGRRTVGWNAAHTHDLQLFVLRREQGRLDELTATVARAVDEHAAYPVWCIWRCVQADLYAQLGRTAEARAILREFARAEFAELPSNEEWLVGMTLLADACVVLGEASTVSALHELLLPYADLHAVGPSEISLGAIARVLGNLSAAAGRFDQAVRQFETAIVLNERIGARPWSAHTRHDYARALIARGDHEKADQQLARALATYRELGMASWADRALTVRYPATQTTSQ